MVRFILFFVLASAALLSCKKDELKYSRVQQLTTNTNYRINNIAVLDDTVCIAGGGSTFYSSLMLRSADGGHSWSIDSSNVAPKEMYGMGISQDGRIFLSGVDGCVLHSADKGRTWQFHRIHNWLTYKGGCFTTSDTGIFVSTVLQRQCTITRVDTAFKIIDEKTFDFGLNGLLMKDSRTGFVFGYGVIMKTTDGGKTWLYLKVDGDNFTAMSRRGSKLWVCGSAGSIFYSDDEGETWQRYRNGNDLMQKRIMLRAILFTDDMHGWVAGEHGIVLYTNNGGRDWMEYKRFTDQTLRSIAQCADGNMLIAGDNGSIFRVAQ
jgi:photosystem II stability/assembly factor-like uncharacterized protein